MVFLKRHRSERHHRRETPVQSCAEDREAEERSCPRSNNGRYICHFEPRRIRSNDRNHLIKLFYIASRMAMILGHPPVLPG